MDSIKSAYKKWLKYTSDDLSWTEANLKEGVWYGACFTAQQAAEKALKAYLINKGKNIKKIHDLNALLEECISFNRSFENLRKECIILTGYYAPSRYPDIFEFVDFTEDKARQSYLFAKTIVEFVKNNLP